MDSHAHAGAPRPDQAGPGFDASRWRGHTHHKLVGLMDAVGVDVAVLHTNDLWAHKFHRLAMAEYPRRLISVYKINQAAMGSQELREELIEAATVSSFRGFYFDPWPADDPQFTGFHRPENHHLWRSLCELRVPVCFVNYGDRSPQRVADLALLLDQFPQLVAILVHGVNPPGRWPVAMRQADGGLKVPPEILRLARKHHVYLEVLTGYIDDDFGPRNEVLQTLYDTLGSSRLLWGSEFAKLAQHSRTEARSASRYRRQLEYLAVHCPYLGQAELAEIRGGNAARIFGLARAAFGPTEPANPPADGESAR